MEIRPIDANALFDALRDNEFQTFCPLDEVDDVIAAAPTLDYAPVRHGEWEWDTLDVYMCSACGEKSHVKEVIGRPDWDYCPNCGAKMGKDG